MYKIIKKSACLFSVLMMFCFPVFGYEKQKIKAVMQSDFVLKEATGDVIFITDKDLKISDEITLPPETVIYAKNIQAQRALRWHKSGCIICKIMGYSTDEFSDEIIDISDKDLYFVARKYEKIYKKDATILTTEILVTQGASFFAPGTDILYFFTKGAILKEDEQNWFLAGVSNAYENSICWFWLKGKPIDLSYGDDIVLKSIEKDRAYELKEKMLKRKYREDMKALKKELKKEFKTIKELETAEIKQIKKEVKEEARLAKKSKHNEIITDEIDKETKDFQAAVKIK